MRKFVFTGMLLLTMLSYGQQLTGEQLLEKAIQYHDPNGNWSRFKGAFQVTMQTPKKPKRVTRIAIDLPAQRFSAKAVSQENTTEYQIDKETVRIVFNGNQHPSEALKKKHKLSADRAKMYQDYYTYLYGLPMKLKDPGTIVHEEVTLKNMNGKSYYVLQVTYDKKVGKDTWFFYFNTRTYAMERYQFFHDVAKNDGEYIVLEGTEIIHGIKMPKKRAWYFNKDDGYLGTDILSQIRA